MVDNGENSGKINQFNNSDVQLNEVKMKINYRQATMALRKVKGILSPDDFQRFLELARLWKLRLNENNKIEGLRQFINENQDNSDVAEVVGSKVIAISLDVPSGYTCHNAQACRACPLYDADYAPSHKDTIGGYKLVRGEGSEFPCYAASLETIFRNSIIAHCVNYFLIASCADGESVYQLLIKSLPNKQDGWKYLMRLNSSGDIWHVKYFEGVKLLAQRLGGDNIIIFGYTKHTRYLKTGLANFKITYSIGGRADRLVNRKNTPVCDVVVDGKNPYRLPIICTDKSKHQRGLDFFYIMRGLSFALEVHSGSVNSAKARKARKLSEVK